MFILDVQYTQQTFDFRGVAVGAIPMPDWSLEAELISPDPHREPPLISDCCVYANTVLS